MPGRKRLTKGHITLARALSKFGVASRKQAGELVLARRVAVNGTVVRSPEMWLDPKVDAIAVDGKVLRRQEFVYLMMNKPVGIVTTRSDEKGRKTVYDLLPGEAGWLFPVGRLDKDSSGLLLFTNDTRLGNKITDPLTELPKTYEVEVDRPVKPADRKQMESLFVLKDGTALKPAQVSVDADDPRRLTITIVEGKNRQIRRLCTALGYDVRALNRVSIGSLHLGDLRSGDVRPLSRAEFSSIVSLVSS